MAIAFPQRKKNQQQIKENAKTNPTVGIEH